MPSYVPTTWYVLPTTIAPAGAWSRFRVPLWMIVNSKRGPLNCSEYDSALLVIDANAPVAGRADGLIHASTETRAVGDTAAFDAIATREFVPENVTALSDALPIRPGAPSVTPV